MCGCRDAAAGRGVWPAAARLVAEDAGAAAVGAAVAARDQSIEGAPVQPAVRRGDGGATGGEGALPQQPMHTMILAWGCWSFARSAACGRTSWHRTTLRRMQVLAASSPLHQPLGHLVPLSARLSCSPACAGDSHHDSDEHQVRRLWSADQNWAAGQVWLPCHIGEQLASAANLSQLCAPHTPLICGW